MESQKLLEVPGTLFLRVSLNILRGLRR